MNTKFLCPHCNSPIEADSTKAGMAADCPACRQSLIIPAVTKWTHPIALISNQLAELAQLINESLLHPDRYPCYQCKTWVLPFFDYEQVSSGGIAMTNQYGMTIYNQNTSTRERVRCRDCGKFLEASGAKLYRHYSAQLLAAQNRLLDFQRQERKWHELRTLAKTRPLLAVFLRVRGFLIRHRAITLILSANTLFFWWFLHHLSKQ